MSDLLGGYISLSCLLLAACLRQWSCPQDTAMGLRNSIINTCYSHWLYFNHFSRICLFTFTSFPLQVGFFYELYEVCNAHGAHDAFTAL